MSLLFAPPLCAILRDDNIMKDDISGNKYAKILRQGVESWNQWREKHPNELVNLTHRGLDGLNLSGASLIRVNLLDANLRGTNLTNCDIRVSSLRMADLTNCDLTGADLTDSDLTEANLTGANFTNVRIGFTTFGDIDFRSVKGLETVRHVGPSTVGIDSIYRSRNIIPEIFLRGCGVSEDFIEFARPLKGKAFEFYSCFLSHAQPDSDFADRLRTDLISKGVSCWHYRYDMRAGRFWRAQINEAIKLHDKLVLICSEQSLLRRNVVDEIIAAMERERETNSQKLFPIRLDDFILSDDMLRLADKKMDACEWREDWVRHVRAYHIPDLRNWKEHDTYQTEFRRLLDGLKNPPKR